MKPKPPYQWPALPRGVTHNGLIEPMREILLLEGI
jgi:hypothetical protein